MVSKTLFEQLPERLKNARSGPVTATNKRSAPSLNRAGSQGVRSAADLPKPEPVSLSQRATTFPVSASIYDSNSRYRTNTVSNPNLRRSFHEVISPAELSFSGTPNSSLTDQSIPPAHYNIPELFSSNNDFPDLSAMMFPSGDPFAYPNQPVTEFDNIKQETITEMQSSRAPPLFLPGGSSGGIYDDLEGQLFGPLPPYLMQGQQLFDTSRKVATENNMLSGLGLQQINYNYTPNVDVNFDGILAVGDDDWSNLAMDQRRG